MGKKYKGIILSLAISLTFLSDSTLLAAPDTHIFTYQGKEYVKSNDYINLEKIVNTIKDNTPETRAQRASLIKHQSAVIKVQDEIKSKNPNISNEELKKKLENSIEQEKAKNKKRSKTKKILGGLAIAGAAVAAGTAGYLSYKNGFFGGMKKAPSQDIKAEIKTAPSVAPHADSPVQTPLKSPKPEPLAAKPSAAPQESALQAAITNLKPVPNNSRPLVTSPDDSELTATIKNLKPVPNNPRPLVTSPDDSE